MVGEESITAQSSQKVKTSRTRILILSDTHTESPKPASLTNYAYREPLPAADVLLHAGDITKVGNMVEYEPMFEMIASHPAELKLVIAGNHDVTLDKKYCQTLHGKRRSRWQDLEAIKQLWCGETAKRRGVVYLEEGTHAFELKGGAKFSIYTSPYQPEFCNWAFAYEHDKDRFNNNNKHPLTSKLPFHSLLGGAPSNPVPDHPKIDIMLTHGPPYGILDMTLRDEEVGCPHLLKACRRVRPQLHCFGHIHEGWGASRMDWTKKSAAAAAGEGAEVAAEQVELDLDKVREERCAYVDISSSSSNNNTSAAATGEGKEAETSNDALSLTTKTKNRPLIWGKETLFVNASIMNVRYQPYNAPWLVDLDLPKR